jgi:hypothetical protein
MINTTIILTSTVNVNPDKCYLYQTDKNERIASYLKSILQWLTKTNFNIVLIENSGYSFPELNVEKDRYNYRFEVITFNEFELEETKYLIGNNSKGASEIFSINYAFLHSNIMKHSVFILKITCRFFIPELEGYLQNYDLNNYDCLTQCNRDRCEMVGTHCRNFSEIFKNNLMNDNNEYIGHVESIYKERTSKYNHILICKEFWIEETQRGGSPERYFCI